MSPIIRFTWFPLTIALLTLYLVACVYFKLFGITTSVLIILYLLSRLGNEIGKDFCWWA